MPYGDIRDTLLLRLQAHKKACEDRETECNRLIDAHNTKKQLLNPLPKHRYYPREDELPPKIPPFQLSEEEKEGLKSLKITLKEKIAQEENYSKNISSQLSQAYPHCIENALEKINRLLAPSLLTELQQLNSTLSTQEQLTLITAGKLFEALLKEAKNVRVDLENKLKKPYFKAETVKTWQTHLLDTNLSEYLELKINDILSKPSNLITPFGNIEACWNSHLSYSINKLKETFWKELPFSSTLKSLVEYPIDYPRIPIYAEVKDGKYCLLRFKDPNLLGGNYDLPKDLVGTLLFRDFFEESKGNRNYGGPSISLHTILKQLINAHPDWKKDPVKDDITQGRTDQHARASEALEANGGRGRELRDNNGKPITTGSIRLFHISPQWACLFNKVGRDFQSLHEMKETAEKLMKNAQVRPFTPRFSSPQPILPEDLSNALSNAMKNLSYTN